MPSVDIYVIAFVVHILLVATRLNAFLADHYKGFSGIRVRGPLLAWSIWAGLLFDMDIVFRRIFEGMPCWITMINTYVSPAIIVAPCFLTCLEYWSATATRTQAAARKDRRRDWKIVKYLVPYPFTPKYAAWCLFGVFLLHLIISAVFIGMRLMTKELENITEDCNLHLESGFAHVIFAVYILWGVFAMSLLLHLKDRRTLLVFELVGMFAWSVCFMGPFLYLSLDPERYASASAHVEVGMLPIMFSMGPVIFYLLVTDAAVIFSWLSEKCSSLRSPSRGGFSMGKKVASRVKVKWSRGMGTSSAGINDDEDSDSLFGNDDQINLDHISAGTSPPALPESTVPAAEEPHSPKSFAELAEIASAGSTAAVKLFILFDSELHVLRSKNVSQNLRNILSLFKSHAACSSAEKEHYMTSIKKSINSLVTPDSSPPQTYTECFEAFCSALDASTDSMVKELGLLIKTSFVERP